MISVPLSLPSRPHTRVHAHCAISHTHTHTHSQSHVRPHTHTSRYTHLQHTRVYTHPLTRAHTPPPVCSHFCNGGTQVSLPKSIT